jgi:hypothetical protein
MAIPDLIDYRPQIHGKRGQRHWKGLSLKYMSNPPDDLQSDMRNNPPTRVDDALWELMEKADPTLRGDATTDDDNPRWRRGVCDD